MHHVLLADDATFSRKLSKLYLDNIHDLNIVIHEAVDGFEVFKILELYDIDIIILDLVMPGKDGFAVLSELKNHRMYGYIPVIVQSALDNPEYISRALMLGAHDYFVKPLGFEAVQLAGIKLHLKVRNAINNYTLYKQAQKELVERAKIEKALRASEERHQAILTQSYDGIMLIDISTRKVVEANIRFSHMMGYYSYKSEINDLTIYALCDETVESIDYYLDEVLFDHKYLDAEVRRFIHKDGHIIYVERTSSLIQYNECFYCLSIVRDITAEQKRQDELRRDLLLAEKVQTGFLPPDADNHYCLVRGLYQPANGVSGDLYDYFWDEKRCCITGYMLDVSGHGMATALIGSALKSLFRQTVESARPLAERLSWLNTAIWPYCNEEFFVAVFYFEIDFVKQVLTYSSGGINYFARSSNGGTLEVTPGQLIGVFDNAVFYEQVLPIKSGDYFLFFQMV